MCVCCLVREDLTVTLCGGQCVHVCGLVGEVLTVNLCGGITFHSFHCHPCHSLEGVPRWPAKQRPGLLPWPLVPDRTVPAVYPNQTHQPTNQSIDRHFRSDPPCVNPDGIITAINRSSEHARSYHGEIPHRIASPWLPSPPLTIRAATLCLLTTCLGCPSLPLNYTSVDLSLE